MKIIFCIIFVGASMLNLVVVPFERHIVDCYEVWIIKFEFLKCLLQFASDTDGHFNLKKMIVQQEIVNNQIYVICKYI